MKGLFRQKKSIDRILQVNFLLFACTEPQAHVCKNFHHRGSERFTRFSFVFLRDLRG